MGTGSGNAEATFSIRLDSNAGDVAPDAAKELEALREKIHGSTDAVKLMNASLRSLRGKSDEVKAAKKQLNALIDAERDSISSANLALLKQGVTYEQLNTKARALAKAKSDADGLANAIKVAGGPVETLKGKFETLKGLLGGSSTSMTLLTLGAAALAAALVAVTASVIGMGVSLVKFIIGGADAARSMNLIREAAASSAESASNLGTQVDALAGKVSTSKEELNKLGASLARTRLSGQAIVDTFNAVGQAAAAAGDDVGNTVKEILTRGAQVNRLQINPLELQGTGLRFEDVASALATQMGVGVKQAQAALFEGRVKLDDGAKAVRVAVEKRFGEINARKLLTLDVQVQKFKERLGALTSDVRLEPLLRGIDQIAKLFDESTVSGAALKQLVTVIGNTLGPAFESVLPIAKAFIKGLIIGALDVTIALLRVGVAAKKAFAGSDLLSGVDTVRLAMTSAKVAIYGVVAGMALLAAAVVVASAPVWLTAAAFYALYEAAVGAWDKLKALDWSGIGSAIVSGIVTGLTGGASAVVGAVVGLASKVKGAFAGALDIHSPSKVFAQYGEHTAEGYAQGVEGGATRAQSAAEGLAPRAPGAGRGGGRSGASTVTVNLTINVEGGGQGPAKELSDPSFLAQMTLAIEQALLGAGIPTQTPVGP